MSEAVDDDDVFPGSTSEDVGRAVDAIKTGDASWGPGTTVALGDGLGWQPDLLRDDPRSVLQVHLADRIRPYLLQRIEAAAALGYRVHLAVGLGTLYDEEFLLQVSSLEPVIHLIDISPARDPIALLPTIAEQGVRVTDETRRELARRAWQACEAAGTSNEKGKRLEALVALLLSQIEDFRVVELNLRTDTEELDAVVQQGRTQGARSWMLGVPFILAEAKNWATKVTQTEVSVFRIKMLGKRGTVRLGLMFAANGYTSDAYEQEMRFASDALTIALIGPEEISAWVDASDDDEYLDALVRRSMLR